MVRKTKFVFLNYLKSFRGVSCICRAHTAGEYHYNLPVIFHVLYKDKNNPLQYVKQDRLAKILDTVNKLYKDKTKSVDMNLTFTLATTDEDGKPLSTPGVEYVLWEEVTLSTVMLHE